MRFPSPAVLLQADLLIARLDSKQAEYLNLAGRMIGLKDRRLVASLVVTVPSFFADLEMMYIYASGERVISLFRCLSNGADSTKPHGFITCSQSPTELQNG